MRISRSGRINRRESGSPYSGDIVRKNSNRTVCRSAFLFSVCFFARNNKHKTHPTFFLIFLSGTGKYGGFRDFFRKMPDMPFFAIFVKHDMESGKMPSGNAWDCPLTAGAQKPVMGLKGTIIKVYIRWCAARDLNPQALRRWDLNPERLPISPAAHYISQSVI